MHSCVATQLYRNAVARLEGEADACSWDHAVQACGDDCTVPEVLGAIVTSDAFRYRRAEVQP